MDDIGTLTIDLLIAYQDALFNPAKQRVFFTFWASLLEGVATEIEFPDQKIRQFTI